MSGVGAQSAAPEPETTKMELPALQGSEKQVEWANKLRADALSPDGGGLHASLLPWHRAALAAAGDQAGKLTHAKDWIDDSRQHTSAAINKMLAHKFGLTDDRTQGVRDPVGNKFRVVEDRIHHNATVTRQGSTDRVMTDFADDDADDLARAFGSREKAAEVAKAFGFTYEGDAAPPPAPTATTPPPVAPPAPVAQSAAPEPGEKKMQTATEPRDMMSADATLFHEPLPPRFDMVGDESHGPFSGLKMTGGVRATGPAGESVVRFSPMKIPALQGKIGPPSVRLAGRPALAAAIDGHEKAVAGHAAGERARSASLAAMADDNPDPAIRHHATATIGGVPHHLYKDHDIDGYASVRYAPVTAGVPTLSTPHHVINTQYDTTNPAIDAAVKFHKVSRAKNQEDSDRRDADRHTRDAAEGVAHAAKIADLSATAKATGRPQVESTWHEEVNEDDNSMNVMTRYVRADGSTYTTTTKTY